MDEWPTVRWPVLRPEWLLYEDDAVLVVHKPAGIPQQPDPERPGFDLPARLREWLGARQPPFVGKLSQPQRVDRDLACPVVFSKQKAATAPLARQFESREVQFEYDALTDRWSYGPSRRVELSFRVRSGRTEVARRRPGIEFEVHARRLDHPAERWRLTIRTRSGRAHEIRALLGHLGAPAVGDSDYGSDVPGPLHLAGGGLTLIHPTLETPLRVHAPCPFDVGHWDLQRLIREALDRRSDLRPTQRTNAVRLFHGAEDGDASHEVDTFGDVLLIHQRSDHADYEPIYDAWMSELSPRAIVVKRRPKTAHHIVDASDEAFSPTEPVRGSGPLPTRVTENGLTYRVDLSRTLSVGLFLDQRWNRRRVQAQAKGQRVLNLFAYTGGFTVAALAGGAECVTTVDASAAAMTIAESNAADLNPSALARCEWVVTDVFAWLREQAKTGHQYDLLIVDPPTYSTVKGSRWNSKASWRGLIASMLTVAAPRARLLATSNDRRMSASRFRNYVEQGVKDAGRRLTPTVLAPPPDFPAAKQTPTLKGIWLE